MISEFLSPFISRKLQSDGFTVFLESLKIETTATYHSGGKFLFIYFFA